MTATDADLTAADVTWDLEPLLSGAAAPDDLIEQAKARVADLQRFRGRVATLEAAELAELMQGRLTLASTLDQGSRFTLELPLGREPRTIAPPPLDCGQQSISLMGQEISRECSTSSTVVGVRRWAFGLSEAWWRFFTTTRAMSSSVMPYLSM